MAGSWDLAKYRLAKWFFLVVGIILAGLTWPLTLKVAEVQVSRIPPTQKLEFLDSLALGIKTYPVPGFLAWLVLVVLVVFVVGRPQAGPKNFKLLWGMLEMTLPDPVIEAERKREDAELTRDAAVEIVDDFAALMALLTPLVDRKDPNLALRILDEICKLGARSVTGESSCRASIWLCEPNGDLRIRASHRIGIRTLELFRLRSGQGLVGQVFQTGRPKTIPDVSQVTSVEFVEDSYSSSQPTTIMGLPLYADANSAQVVGVICFSHRGTKDRFLASDLRLGQPYGMLASLVLTILKSLGISLP
ncbi:MAG: GAF domain-containing protein [Thermoanaerobaculia bacterium]